VDDGELRGFRAQRDAADARLQLAHDKYEGISEQVAALHAKVTEQNSVISDLSSKQVIQLRTEHLDRNTRDQLEKLFNSSTEIKTAVTNLSTSTSGLGDTLTVVKGVW